jgi:ADP-ribosylglycohydrolase
MNKNEILPSYAKQPTWECYAKELDVEFKQSMEEGKDIGIYKELFETVFKMPENKYKNELADVLYKLVSEAPQREDFSYVEPSDLEEIRKERAPFEVELQMPDDETLKDKILGAWYGRICGCLLGKPVESIMSDDMKKVLERTGNYPMTRYIDKEEITEEVEEGVSYPIKACAYPRDFGRMPCDDDTNYMIVGLRLLQWHGRDFTSENVAQTWLGTQVKNAYCTAERIAYRNFVMGYLPPASAEYKNPYREWIGAQIRGDFFGYINPCDPETAADMAHRDACISHIKNGIYGEMWISAMLTAAFGCDDVEKVIRRGMAELPRNSRIVDALEKIIDKYNSGVSMEDCFADIHARWDEHNGHDWTHTVSNAEIVAASLLYGEKDYARSVGMSVMTGFDTDCNGATVGSVLGVMLGYKALPASFTDRVCDTLESNIMGFHRVSIKEMAEKTMPFVKK